MPPTSPAASTSAPGVRGVFDQVMAAAREFWWGYWQAPPGC